MVETQELLLPEEAKQVAPEDQAAHGFQTLLPMFRNALKNLSSKQIKRVIGAMVEYPFQEGTFKFSTAEERQAFGLGCALFDYKFVMMKTAFELQKEQINSLMTERKEENETTVD